MMTTTPRIIRPHKGGRTARAPEARIRPQTLERIKHEMKERGVSFADLIEEIYGDNPRNCSSLVNTARTIA